MNLNIFSFLIVASSIWDCVTLAQNVPAISNSQSNMQANALQPATATNIVGESNNQSTNIDIPLSKRNTVVAKKFQETTSDGSLEVFKNLKISEAKHLIKADLAKYCSDYCSILNISAEAEEIFDAAKADLGFENAANRQGRNFKQGVVRVDVMVDRRYGNVNTERLKKLLDSVSQVYPFQVEFNWQAVTYPDSTVTTINENQVKSEFINNIRSQTERIIAEFCPRDCKVNQLQVDFAKASIDESNSGQTNRYLFVPEGKGSLFVKGLDLIVAVNRKLSPSGIAKIGDVLRQSLMSYGAVSVKLSEIDFPKSGDDIQKERDDERSDPYGIDRLGKMLRIFKEFASTKETLKEVRFSESNSQSQSEKTQAEKSTASEKLTASEKSNSESSNTTAGGFWTTSTLLVGGGILVAIIAVTILGLRFVASGKQARQVLFEGANGGAATESRSNNGSSGGDSRSEHASPGNATNPNFREKMEAESLYHELMSTFTTQPKVAREVFGRALRDDNLEYCSKLVAVFGEMIIFELLGDADLKQEIETLAEYVHINTPTVSDEDRLTLLRTLKPKLTAGKMRLMANKSMEVFDFVKSLSPRQVFDLIRDENPRSQGIVLTQLSTDKRRHVFELFEGQSKVELLRQLCNGDVVAKDYLVNVADALKRKAMTKNEFNGENVKGTDVLLDLMERADLPERQALLTDLDRSNSDVARILRSRLITMETLAYLRDGLLLEIFLGMDINTMASFLAGTSEQTRNLVLSKAPADIAQDWMETISTMRGTDMETQKLAEMQVIAKVRSFVSSGYLNLIEINGIIYPISQGNIYGDASGAPNQKVFKISNPLVA